MPTSMIGTIFTSKGGEVRVMVANRRWNTKPVAELSKNYSAILLILECNVSLCYMLFIRRLRKVNKIILKIVNDQLVL